jgi:hypothetical protein
MCTNAATMALAAIATATTDKDGYRYGNAANGCPLPTCRADICAFLGRTGYYRPCIKNYRVIVKPLMAAITGPFTKEEWQNPMTMTEEMEQAFTRLKTLLVGGLGGRQRDAVPNPIPNQAEECSCSACRSNDTNRRRSEVANLANRGNGWSVRFRDHLEVCPSCRANETAGKGGWSAGFRDHLEMCLTCGATEAACKGPAGTLVDMGDVWNVVLAQKQFAAKMRPRHP